MSDNWTHNDNIDLQCLFWHIQIGQSDAFLQTVWCSYVEKYKMI